MNNFEATDHEVAIVGMAGRFPGARNVDEFWQNIQNGVESIAFFSDQEIISSGVDPGVLNDPVYVKAHGMLADIELFDAAFFGFSPREAETLDPQQRLFLECAWEALENAGYDAEIYKGRIGVYAGTGTSSYLLRLLSNPDFVNSIGSNQIAISNEKDYVSTRTSYKLNLSGPSISVQTACSTSLVAVHLACQSLLNGESDIVLAGGVSIQVPQKIGYHYQEGAVRSPDGHCRAFDARAQGFVSGSGVAIVVLKRLTDALTDGDCIYAVIKGSAINNDGALKIGYTAPSTTAQAQVIIEALGIAEVEPETVTYIEAHGTGTPLGDPIEMAALTQAFRAGTQKNGYCAIGSVKTNIGHLDTAAGVVGLIKTALALKHRLLPPSLHFEQPNPAIDFANSPFYVNTRLTSWETDQMLRRAGVSSFGIGGTNVHVVLEEAPAVEATDPSNSWQLLLLSAKTASALETATDNLAEHLKEHPALRLADIAYTTQNGRRAMRHRRIAVCRDVADAMAVLEIRDSRRLLSAVQESQNRPVVFLFPGSGAQYMRMGLELYQHEAVFREQVNGCAELLIPHLGLDMRSILYPADAQADMVAQRLRQTDLAMPALFVTEYALAKLWMSWGIHPQAMIGHSLGEYAAACLAGVFSLPDVLALVALRGRLLGQLPEGVMLSVPLSAQEVEPLLTPGLSLAAINGPSLCVVSGSLEAIAEMETVLDRMGLEGRRVYIGTALHSEMVEPVVEPFTRAIERFHLQAPRIPYLSNVTGTWITAQEASSPSYWAAHLRQAVRFAEGMETLLREPDLLLLEVGPGHTLSVLARQQGSTRPHAVFPSLRPLREQPSEMASMLTTVGHLWLAGVAVDWSRFSAHKRRQRIPLPTYPFERQRYWIEQRPKSTGTSQTEVRRKSEKAFRFFMPSWKRSVLPGRPPYRDSAEQERNWLVFADECGLAAQIAARLKSSGQTVAIVTTGAQLSKISNACYTINPRAYGDYVALFAEFAASNRLPHRVVHLWGITPGEQLSAGSEPFEAGYYRGFGSLLFLVQALSNQPGTQPLEIVVVSNNVQDVIGGEVISAEKATLLGPCQVISQEYPDILCRTLDIELPRPGMWPEAKLIDTLLAELATDSSDRMIAYRGNHRWVQTFEDLHLDVVERGSVQLREGGRYLIVDGPGNLGLVLAGSLFSRLRPGLVIVESLAFPPRDTWEQWLTTHTEPTRTGHRIRQIQTLEEEGAEILVVHADVTDRESMQAVIKQAHEYFGEIHGVVSIVGFIEDAFFGAINEMRSVECVHYLQAKMAGLFTLEQVLQDKTLDFCLVCSSLSSVFGGKGRVLEVAMNHLVDAFVCRHNQAVLSPWLHVSWDGGWQLSAVQESHANLEKLFSGLIFTPAEVTEAFQKLLSTTASRFLVLVGDLQTRRAAWLEREPIEARAEAWEANTQFQSRSDYVAPGSEIERMVALVWQELLGIEKPGIHDNFFESGGHSLIAGQLIVRLRKALLVEIPLQCIFERPTIAGLSEVAEELFVEKLEQLSEEEVGRLMSDMFRGDY